MTEATAKLLKRAVLASVAAATLFAGFAAAPALLTRPAEAQQIVIQPPRGAPMSFADLVERVSPAVVSIEVKARPEARSVDQQIPPDVERWLRRYGFEPPAEPREATSLGSGFFIRQDGVIVTNHHVVDRAIEIKVNTSSGKTLDAELVGSDPLTDVAVLRVKGGGSFPFVNFNGGTAPRVGDWVVAVGNPFGLEGSVSAGIVSAISRRDVGSVFVDFIQIDAPINRGNSGGPTFDLQGRVIGVNSAIISPTGGSVGIGFAIPAATADQVVRQILQQGRVSRGWLGVQVQPMDEQLARSYGLKEPTGALVAEVFDDSPASRAGIQRGDLILSVDGQEVENQSDLTRKVGGGAANRSARFEVLREGERRTLTVKLGERPGERQLASIGAPGARPGAAAPADDPDAIVREAGLGLSVRSLSADERRRRAMGTDQAGLVISELDRDSDLFEKGVREGFVILEAGGRPTRNAADLTAAVAAARKADQPLRLLVATPEGRQVFIAADVKAG